MFRPDPTIDESAVVADLVAAILNGFHDVQVLISRNLAQRNVPNFKHRGIDGHDGAKLSRLNTSGHRLAVWAEGHRLARAQLSNLTRSPAHQQQAPMHSARRDAALA